MAALRGHSSARGEGGLCGTEGGCPQGETGQACFVCPGRLASLGREPVLSGPAGNESAWGTGAGSAARRGSWPGRLAAGATQGSKITTPICTRISKHKTPKRGHSKPKAAANHLFLFFFFLKLAATKNFQTLKHNTQLNIFIHL